MAFGISSCSASTGLDHLYSVAALTDADGNVVERYRYDAYGDMTVEDVDGDGKLTGNPYGFTGRRYDAETGLWYFRARYFDSGLGRFISRDPLGYVDGKSMYGGYFVPNMLDPLGLKVTETSMGAECGTILVRINDPELANEKVMISMMFEPDGSCECDCGDVEYSTDVSNDSGSDLSLNPTKGDGLFGSHEPVPYWRRLPGNKTEWVPEPCQYSCQPLFDPKTANEQSSATITFTATCPDPQGEIGSFSATVTYNTWSSATGFMGKGTQQPKVTINK